MPYLRRDAPASVPDAETLDELLGLPNRKSKKTRAVKTRDQLSETQRKRKHLVSLGIRQTRIQGDPFGMLHSWAGNIAHPEDERIFDILEPLFDELMAANMSNSDQVMEVRSLLEMIPTTPFEAIVQAHANEKTCNIIRETDQETVITFELRKMTVRLMQCHDIDKDDKNSYIHSRRAEESREKTKRQLLEPPMTKELTQYIMARLMTERRQEFLDRHDPTNSSSSNSSGEKSSHKGLFYNLRTRAQEEYWLHMSEEQRRIARVESSADPQDTQMAMNLNLVKVNWQDAWNTAARYPDYFGAYVMDQSAASRVWEQVQEDIFVIVDVRRRAIFANIESLCQLLLGQYISDILVRCLDMWSYFTPLPAPESCRHVLDNYIRKLHPELDPSEATIDTLASAKMTVAHYGCWSKNSADRNGRQLVLTKDSKFNRGGEQDNPQKLFPRFCRAVLGKATVMIRFLMKPLDPTYYDECVGILGALDSEDKINTDPQDFLSLFALGVNGYTQRHKDRNDIAGGFAGLCTLGRYTGGSLCVPDLNIKVPYRPGSCALLRGAELDHLVEDFKGLRVFLIGTNHESVKRHAWRKLGKLPPLPPRKKDSGESTVADEDSEERENFMATTCVNRRTDADDEIVYTNKEIHGSAVLPDFVAYSSTGSSLA